MVELFSKYKLYLLLVLGVVVAIIVWISFSGGSEPSSLVTTESASDLGVSDRGLVDTLLQLRAVSLSGSIFSDPAFMSLRDFGTQIVPEEVGRPNPFAPISARAATSTQSAQPSGRARP